MDTSANDRRFAGDGGIVADELDKLIESMRELAATVNESYGNVTPMRDVVGSIAPPLTKTDLAAFASRAADRLATVDRRRVRKEWKAAPLIAEINYLRTGVVANLWNGNWNLALATYKAVIDQVVDTFSGLYVVTVDWEAIADQGLLPTALAKRARVLRMQLTNVEKKAEGIGQRINVINSAYEAALNLPTDLEALQEARDQTAELKDAAQRDAVLAAEALKGVVANGELIQGHERDAKKLLEGTEDAYSAATTKGLGQSFQERADLTAKSMWYWVVGLIAALALSAWLGVNRVALVEKMIEQKAPPAITQLHTLLAVLSIAAPVWFAWIATKQIGQRFRLSEDYAYKASVAKAYEGYRREAARFDDPAFTDRLFRTALDRLDEPPLRFVENETHGSPFHEWWKMRRAAREGAKEAVEEKMPIVANPAARPKPKPAQTDDEDEEGA